MFTPKKICLLKAVSYAVIGVVLAVVLALPSSHAKNGLVPAIAAGFIFLGFGGYHYWRFLRTPAEKRFYDIREQPPAEQIRVSQRALVILLVAGVAMSVWTYHDLSQLERGEAQSVRLWAPVAILYDHVGFWPAVAVWPVFCLFGAAMAFFRIESAKAQRLEEPTKDPR